MQMFVGGGALVAPAPTSLPPVLWLSGVLTPELGVHLGSAFTALAALASVSWQEPRLCLAAAGAGVGEDGQVASQPGGSQTLLRGSLLLG